MAKNAHLPCGCARGSHGRKDKDIMNCKEVKRRKRDRTKRQQMPRSPRWLRQQAA